MALLKLSIVFLLIGASQTKGRILSGFGYRRCNADSDCKRGLVCGKNNCVGIMSNRDDDCCVKSVKKGPTPGDDNYCSQYVYKCGVGAGDCDADSDCQSGLVCGENNCHGTMFDKNDDCCVKPVNKVPKMYYLNFSFANSGPNVVVKWTQNGIPMELNIPSGHTVKKFISFKSVTQPAAMQFRIYEAGTDKVLQSFQGTPTLQQGETQTVIKISPVPKMYYINLSFVNSGPNVVVKWTQNGNPKELNIFAGQTYPKSISFKSVTKPSAMIFRIYEVGTEKVLQSFQVTPTLQQGETKVLKIGPVAKMYYISLTFVNSGPNVVVKWTQNGNAKVLNIFSGQTYPKSISFMSATQPSAMQFKIYEAGTEKVLQSFQVTPTLQQVEAKVIKIGPVAKMYYYQLSFVNSGPNVVVKWTQNGNPKELKIASGHTKSQTFGFKSVTQPSAIPFIIYEASTGKVVRSFQVTPTLQQGHSMLIKIVPKMYYIKLSFVNSGPNVVVKWTQNGNEKMLNIFSGQTYPKSISFMSVTQPSAMQFRIYEAGTEKVLQSFQETPTLQQGETKVIKIGPVAKMYHINLRFVNPGPGVVVKWTQNGNPEKLNIASGYIYPKSISFKSVTQPSAMQFTIIEAGTGKVLQSFQVTPTLQQVEAKEIKIGPVAEMYYINLSFINSRGPNVVVKWTQNGDPKELYVASGYTYTQKISFKSATQPSAMQFRIYEAGTEKVVKYVRVTPTLQQVVKVIKIS